MSIFDKWNKEVNVKALAEDVKAAAENSGSDENVPHGTYEGYIKEMELKETKKGDPMLAIQFKIVDGPYKNKILFINMMLTKPFLIHKANLFMRSLGSGVEVEFKDYGQYNDVINEVFDVVDSGQWDHKLDYSENDKGYDEYKILEVFKA